MEDKMYCTECGSTDVLAKVGNSNPQSGPMETRSFCKRCATFTTLTNQEPEINRATKLQATRKIIEVAKENRFWNHKIEGWSATEVLEFTQSMIDGNVIYKDNDGFLVYLLEDEIPSPPVVEEPTPTKRVKVHEHGYVELVDKMGTDKTIADAARTSYGKGTKSVSDDENLIRYLLRHKHTTPFEMCEMVFHIKAPLFVFRQWQRHRTASINEYSGRYSVMDSDFYVPEEEYLRTQSTANKQGKSEEISDYAEEAGLLIDHQSFEAYKAYNKLLEEHKISRELARAVLPVNYYSQMIWKMDLHNLFHFLKLRMDSHAQQEIRDYANVVADMVKENFPVAWKAFEDYSLNSLTFTALELKALANVTIDINGINFKYEGLGMSKREETEFAEKFEYIISLRGK